MEQLEDSTTSFTIVIIADIFLSEEVIVICHWFIYTVMCQTISTFGVGTNIINIICFVKQGFRDPVNVSFLGLAISDLGCLLIMTVTNICFTPPFTSANLPFDPVAFAYLVGGIPHTTFTRITCWFTALITLERCLCIIAPLKVKSIITSKRMTILLICIFIILVASVAPVYVVNRMDMKFFPEKNKTLLGLIYTEDRERVEKFALGINNAILTFTSFAIIITCTLILTFVLRQKSEWLKRSSRSQQSDNVSARNKRVTKMVVMISIIFIVCFIPLCVVLLALCLLPEFSLYGKYRHIVFLTGGIGFILETINSSTNIFIYYQMSSKYKQVFKYIFVHKKRN